MSESQSNQFSIWQVLVWTSLVGLGVSVPEFAVFAPFFVGLIMILLGIVCVVWLVASLVESHPKQIARAAKANFFSLLLVGLGAIAYAIYGYLVVCSSWQMG